ncbi:hypothetical protein BGW36DRAFT_371837 [Talaromyces proteolyticus]|uniref:Uncharacterized protein n=1 Tax=Talaromyces proteolyticus TaxID=1131652 RepID=A0AAD4Q3L8_9EURO|nr:uncharacterized protein BGW36DRAFT_371837 [Talaromyces proteolyticus]KAH8701916.1 hypothetical protein BGW36DRAFT_371837 [Talaromyces proteolyticus]
MDSMRSLNKSLPSSTAYSQPPEQLLQAFRSAALSVTNLYKSAVTDVAQAKQSGYQEAIEDLLHFLDRENLGLGDGEGWKVRQWATERVDGTPANESDDDDKPMRSSSPSMNRKDRHDKTHKRQGSISSSTRTDPPTEQQQQPPTNYEQPTVIPSGDSTAFTRTPVFTFSSGPPFPAVSQDTDTETADNVSMESGSSGETTGVGLSVLPRNAWAANRHNAPRRSSTRESGTSFSAKRKHQFPDFFDISSIHGRDMFGGGKRGRFA